MEFEIKDAGFTIPYGKPRKRAFGSRRPRLITVSPVAGELPSKAAIENNSLEAESLEIPGGILHARLSNPREGLGSPYLSVLFPVSASRASRTVPDPSVSDERLSDRSDL